ncbi:MAG: c-type cytochrome [Bdellovibrionales bacterium]|nr:c-type cytochrome [Bdellovibrionales bacterium]
MAEKDELLEHEHDGIREYDNDLPRWWLAIFWLSGIFAVLYVGWLHFGPGLYQDEALARDMKALEEYRTEYAKKNAGTAGGEVGESQLLAFAKNSDRLLTGQNVFVKNCAACHGENGQGIVGPNLTDNYWIHGGTITDIKRIVENGVLEKGMLSWKDQLPPDELNSVVAYVWSLHGTNPPNPKAPEGQEVPRS